MWGEFNAEESPQRFEVEPDREEESSDALREQYLTFAEKMLKAEIERRSPKMPKTSRSPVPLTGVNMQEVGSVEQVRRYQHQGMRGNGKIFFVDFDDVINHTTAFTDAIEKFCVEHVGITSEEFQELYGDSKLANAEGKKILRFAHLVQQLEEKYPEAEGKLDTFLGTLDYEDYIDNGVKRALLAIKMNPENRVVILTQGDREFQRSRILNTDLDAVVDDIIYTEGSKQEVVSAILERDYGKKQATSTNKGFEDNLPIVLTIDDSAEHVEDYEALPLTRWYLNVQYHNPQAKRYGQEVQNPDVLDVRESSPNHAALNLYRVAEILDGQIDDGSRKGFGEWINHEENYQQWLQHYAGTDFQFDIHYAKDAKGSILRHYKVWQAFEGSMKDAKAEDITDREEETDNIGMIGENGSLVGANGKARKIYPQSFDFEEFIREAPAGMSA